MGFLTDNCKIVRVKNGVVAGTSDNQDSTGVDCSGYNGVAFLSAFGAIAATGTATMKAQDSATDGSYADVADTALTALVTGNANKCAFIDLGRPQKQWNRVRIARATDNSVIDGVWAILYDPILLPVVQDTSIAQYEQHFSPADGTA